MNAIVTSTPKCRRVFLPALRFSYPHVYGIGSGASREDCADSKAEPQTELWKRQMFFMLLLKV